MPRYEYRCRECGDTFELSRPMAESSLSAPCPGGHADTVKLLSTVALAGARSGAAAGSGAAGSGAPAPAAGGCCGGGCCG